MSALLRIVRCPSAIGLLIFVILIAAMQSRFAISLRSITCCPVIVVASVATLGYATYVEVARLWSNVCSWSANPILVRATGYLALWIIGVFIAWPGLSMDRDILLVFRLEFPLFLVAALVVTTIHLRREPHGE